MTKLTVDPPSLFVWKGKCGDYVTTGDHKAEAVDGHFVMDLPELYGGYEQACPFCKGEYRVTLGSHNSWDHANIFYKCELCGFNYHFESFLALEAYFISEEVTLSALRKMDIEASELGLDELGSHLRRRFEDIYSLTPRRFEQLVADIFRSLGYYPRLTQETRDGGYDIMLFEQQSGVQIIVECKRYAQSRKISVGTVRELLGVQLQLGVPKAKLVTTTSFTAPAQETANRINNGASGYELDLIDGGRLFDALGVYNSELPPLWLDKRFSE